MKIVKPLPKMYCQGTKCGLSIYLTTKGPKDHNSPADKTTGTAILGLLSSNICRNLVLNRIFYNKNVFTKSNFDWDDLEKNNQ